MEERASKENKVTSHFKIKEGAIKKNEVVEYSEREKRIESINEDISEISFLDQEIIIYK